MFTVIKLHFIAACIYCMHNSSVDFDLCMLQAAVRGLDTVADFAAKLQPGVLKIDKFVVTGASKVMRVLNCTLSTFVSYATDN